MRMLIHMCRLVLVCVHAAYKEYQRLVEMMQEELLWRGSSPFVGMDDVLKAELNVCASFCSASL